MNNNRPQPLLPRRPLGGFSGESRESQSTSVAVMAPGLSAASSSNSGRAPEMEDSVPKRRRLTSKQPAVPPVPPTVVVTESASVTTLFEVKIINFPPGALGLEPLILTDVPLQNIMEARIAMGNPFKLKVEMGWEAKKLVGDG